MNELLMAFDVTPHQAVIAVICATGTVTMMIALFPTNRGD